MATLTESEIRVRLEVRRMADGTAHVIAHAASYAATGQRIRDIELDITDQLSAARQAGTESLLADVETRLKAFWEIP